MKVLKAYTNRDTQRVLEWVVLTMGDFKVTIRNAWQCMDGPKGGAPGAHPPPPPKIGKNIICWRIIVIFHTKTPKCSRLPPGGPPPPNLKSWIRPCNGP
jgi:hypothetical protein